MLNPLNKELPLLRTSTCPVKLKHFSGQPVLIFANLDHFRCRCSEANWDKMSIKWESCIFLFLLSSLSNFILSMDVCCRTDVVQCYFRFICFVQIASMFVKPTVMYMGGHISSCTCFLAFYVLLYFILNSWHGVKLKWVIQFHQS